MINLINYFKSTTMAALTHLGLFNQSEQTHYSREEEEEEEDHSPNYLLLINNPSPSLIPVPIHVVKTHIKKKLPVLEFSQFLLHYKQDQDSSVHNCPICLDCFESIDQVRDLVNCDHVFHMECLDNWVNQGHFTCPLCRSMLFQEEDQSEILKAIHELG